jgi:hypothetical protein
MSTKVITCKGRLSWVFLAEPQKGKKPEDTAKYSTDFLMRDEDIRKVNPKTGKTFLEDLQQAIVDAWNEDAPKAKQVTDVKNWSKIKNTLKYIDANDDMAPSYARGCWRIAGKNKEKPGVVDAGNVPLDQEAIKKIKAGDHAKVLLNFYSYEVDGSKGVAGSLRGVQLIQSGEPFVAKTDLSKEFDVEEIAEADAGEAFDK